MSRAKSPPHDHAAHFFRTKKTFQHWFLIPFYIQLLWCVNFLAVSNNSLFFQFLKFAICARNSAIFVWIILVKIYKNAEW